MTEGTTQVGRARTWRGHSGLGMSVRAMAVVATACLLAACAAEPPDGPPAVSAEAPVTVLDQTYRPALGAAVPVPRGWDVHEYFGTPTTVMTPPGFIPHGPRFTVERLSGTPAVAALQDRCAPRPPAAVIGPSLIAGHPGSYQFLCQPRTRIGAEWTAVLPGAGSLAVWRLTFVGAAVIGGRDPLSRDFLAVLTEFRTTQ